MYIIRSSREQYDPEPGFQKSEVRIPVYVQNFLLRSDKYSTVMFRCVLSVYPLEDFNDKQRFIAKEFKII